MNAAFVVFPNLSIVALNSPVFGSFPEGQYFAWSLDHLSTHHLKSCSSHPQRRKSHFLSVSRGPDGQHLIDPWHHSYSSTDRFKPRREFPMSRANDGPQFYSRWIMREGVHGSPTEKCSEEQKLTVLKMLPRLPDNYYFSILSIIW